MENVLGVYKRPYDPLLPVVCLDETSKQLIGETRTPICASPGQKARYDYEYKRNGVANIFMMSEPLAGQRHVRVPLRGISARRGQAYCGSLGDSFYAKARKLVEYGRN